MSPKVLLGSALLVFALGTVVYMVIIEARATAPEDATSVVADRPGASGPNAPSPAAHRVVVTYFHGTKRCATCRDLETFAREALETGFPDALLAGTLEWRAVNTEDAGNEHFVIDYELASKALVVADLRDGRQVRYKKLDKMWDLVGDKPSYTAYIQSETRAYLDEAR